MVDQYVAKHSSQDVPSPLLIYPDAWLIERQQLETLLDNMEAREESLDFPHHFFENAKE